MSSTSGEPDWSELPLSSLLLSLAILVAVVAGLIYLAPSWLSAGNVSVLIRGQ